MLRAPELLGTTEVCDLEDAVQAEQQVVGLQIAVLRRVAGPKAPVRQPNHELRWIRGVWPVRGGRIACHRAHQDLMVVEVRDTAAIVHQLSAHSVARAGAAPPQSRT